jgi:hypothetical protein
MMIDRYPSVQFAGENHMITLFDDHGAACACASLWRASYSPVGCGTALFLWYGDRRVLLTDAPALACHVRDRFNQYFAGFAERDFGAIIPTIGQVAITTGQPTPWRASWRSAGGTVELWWDGIFEAALERFDNTSGPQRYAVSAVISNCRAAGIAVDGQPLAGTIGVPAGESLSSGFLAFSETWCDA